MLIEIIRAARRLPPQKPSEEELWRNFQKVINKSRAEGSAPTFGSGRDPGCAVM